MDLSDIDFTMMEGHDILDLNNGIDENISVDPSSTEDATTLGPSTLVINELATSSIVEVVVNIDSIALNSRIALEM